MQWCRIQIENDLLILLSEKIVGTCLKINELKKSSNGICSNSNNNQIITQFYHYLLEGH